MARRVSLNVDTSSEMKDSKEILHSPRTSKFSPAALVAAGRAAQKVSPKDNAPQVSPGRVFNNNMPFKSANRQPSSGRIPNLMDYQTRNRQEIMRAVPPLMNLKVFDHSVGSKSPKTASKMMDSKMYKPGPDKDPEYAENTHCQKLYEFTVKYQLGVPEFSNFHKTDPKKNKTLYVSRVKIANFTFSSMPFEHPNLDVIQEHVAKIALEELSDRYENKKSAELATATEKQQIIGRVADIVSSHPQGLRSDVVEKNFEERYKEKLPVNWLEMITTLSLLSVEKLLGGIFVYPPQDVLSSSNDVKRLPWLILPESDLWNIFVTTCLSTNYVYFRIVGEEYDSKYEQMCQKMDQIYKSSESEQKPADVIKEGNYYAACLQGDWFRVKVLSANLGDNCKVSLIDQGETEEVLKKLIFPLEDELTDLPAQAIRCSLTGLERFHDDEYVTRVLCDMTFDSGSTFVAEVNLRNPHLTLTLFDTRTNEDININKIIEERITKELASPKIPTQNNLGEVYVTSVQEDGRAFVQIISEGLILLASLMADVNQDMLKHADKYSMKSISDLVGEKLVLAKYDGDQLWHRAMVISVIKEDHTEAVEVRFIDYGNVEMVSLRNIAKINHFVGVLSAIKPQAVEVQLVRPSQELFTQSVIDFLMSITQVTDDNGNVSRLFLMKVIKSNIVPDVELYIRLPEGKVVALNDLIGSYYSEYQSSSFKRVDVNLDLNKSWSSIQPFALPEPEEPFEVHVSMIINPSHFIVQPLQHREELQRMTAAMKNYYSAEKPRVDVQYIQEGNVFAVENSEKKWCRGMVTQVLGDMNAVSIKCIDYGDVIAVDFKNVFLLMPCFRKLPALAIKAELAGIMPVHSEWQMNDCLRFHELLAKKEFLSIVVDIQEDMIDLILFDTSSGTPVDVGSVLVEEKRATDITTR